MNRISEFTSAKLYLVAKWNYVDISYIEGASLQNFHPDSIARSKYSTLGNWPLASTLFRNNSKV
jgi:hypothetical protein